MQVKEAMSSQLNSVDKSASLQEAAEKMAQWDLGALPVFEEGQLVGIVTDRDIAVRGMAKMHSPDTPVGEVMSGTVRCVFEDEEIEEAADVMGEHQVRRVVVFDHEKHPKGILALADLAHEDSDGSLCGQVLKRVTKPTVAASV